VNGAEKASRKLGERVLKLCEAGAKTELRDGAICSHALIVSRTVVLNAH